MFETTNQLLFFSGCLLYIKWRTPKFLLNLIYSVWDVCRILVTSNQQDMANPRCQRKQVRKCYYNHHPAVHQRTYLSLAVLIEYRHVYIATQYIINMYICISAYIYIYYGFYVVLSACWPSCQFVFSWLPLMSVSCYPPAAFTKARYHRRWHKRGLPHFKWHMEIL